MIEQELKLRSILNSIVVILDDVEVPAIDYRQEVLNEVYRVGLLAEEVKELREENTKLKAELHKCHLAVGKLIGFTPESCKDYVDGYCDAIDVSRGI